MSDSKSHPHATVPLKGPGGSADSARDLLSEATSSVLNPGNVIADRYEINELLGKGGMGRVYRAWDRRLHRDVAVKLMRERARASEHGEQLEKRFADEAMLPAAIPHPNIITIHDRGRHENGQDYFVMEFIHGAESLEDVVEAIHLRNRSNRDAPKQYLDLGLLREYLMQACAGLGALHAVPGAWHRDIKLANLLVFPLPGGDPALKLIDFGIAHRPGADLTEDGTNLGTISYMSPEAFAYNGNKLKGTDSRSDLFALGIVAYKCMTMRHPWPTIRDFPSAMAAHQTGRRPLLPSYFRPELRESGWDTLIMRAIARDRDQRYQTAMEFRADLVRLADLGPYTGIEGVTTEDEAEAGAAPEFDNGGKSGVPTYNGPIVPIATPVGRSSQSGSYKTPAGEVAAPVIQPSPARRAMPLAAAFVGALILALGVAYVATQRMPEKDAATVPVAAPMAPSAPSVMPSTQPEPTQTTAPVVVEAPPPAGPERHGVPKPATKTASKGIAKADRKSPRPRAETATVETATPAPEAAAAQPPPAQPEKRRRGTQFGALDDTAQPPD